MTDLTDLTDLANVDDIITEQEMTGLVAQGAAVPLLGYCAPCPMNYRDQWWAVQAEQTGYRPVTEQAQLALIVAHQQRGAGLREFAAALTGGRDQS